jgi:hypothetical protein
MMRAETTLADDVTLTETLCLAAPLFLADLATRPARDHAAVALRWAADGARAVGERGDLLQFVNPGSTTTRLKVANTFEQLARGIAGLVVLHSPGVEFAGLHWCLQAACARCRPAQPEPSMTRKEMNAELWRLDAEYRALNGLPPWEPQSTPQPAPTPPARLVPKPRSIITVHLPEVA